MILYVGGDIYEVFFFFLHTASFFSADLCDWFYPLVLFFFSTSYAGMMFI